MLLLTIVPNGRYGKPLIHYTLYIIKKNNFLWFAD